MTSSPRKPQRALWPPICSSAKLVEPLGEDDPPGGLDQREGRERLGEVAQVTAALDVELLGVEPERRRHVDQPRHQVAGALDLADDRERRDEPERADHERSSLPESPSSVSSVR